MLRVLYDQIIRNDKRCVVTYIDYSAAFDSVSHKFIDKTLTHAGASRKTRAIFRAIYEAAAGVARVSGIDGTYTFSGSFAVRRGVIQGDIISPVLFILALDQLVQTFDRSGEGVKCGRILKMRVLGYADDAALVESTVEAMTKRLTELADASRREADMEINMAKTFTQHVFKREKIKVSAAEVSKVEAKYEHKCDFCERRFKTLRGMRIHRSKCKHNYDTTGEVFELEEILGVFGHKHARWMKVKWSEYEEPEWEREHLLRRDGCHEAIREFWTASGLDPTKGFHQHIDEPDRPHRCTVCAKSFKRLQDLRAHCTRAGHKEKPKQTTKTAVKDAITEKRKQQQKMLPKVRWGDTEAGNCWLSKYLGSLFQADGGQMTDVRQRIAMARSRFGKLRHVWRDGSLHINLRMRLYKACVCSILTYGSEAWRLNREVRRALNGANSQMVAVITGRSAHEEAADGKTFDMVMWIRARRLQWLGHILRMGTDRQLKHAVFEMFKDPREGDLLMDAPERKSWRCLCTYACDREYWRARVRAMKQPKVARTVAIGSHLEAGATVPFTISS